MTTLSTLLFFVAAMTTTLTRAQFHRVGESPKSSTAVVICKHWNNNAHNDCCQLSEGDYDLSVIQACLGNDQLSRVETSSLGRIRLYKHAGFQGTYWDVGTGSVKLGGINFANDQISSVKVRSGAQYFYAYEQSCTTVHMGSQAGTGAANSCKSKYMNKQGMNCPPVVDKRNWKGSWNYDDTFDVHVSSNSYGDTVTACRTDSYNGWGMNLKFRCCNCFDEFDCEYNKHNAHNYGRRLEVPGANSTAVVEGPGANSTATDAGIGGQEDGEVGSQPSAAVLNRLAELTQQAVHTEQVVV